MKLNQRQIARLVEFIAGIKEDTYPEMPPDDFHQKPHLRILFADHLTAGILKHHSDQLSGPY